MVILLVSMNVGLFTLPRSGFVQQSHQFDRLTLHFRRQIMAALCFWGVSIEISNINDVWHIKQFVIAERFEFKKSKSIEKHSKYCITNGAPKHNASFLKDELCASGEEGCQGVETSKHFEVLCDLVKVSKCYSDKKCSTETNILGWIKNST